VNGDCNPANGDCTCYKDYLGVSCDQKCIDINCTIICNSNTSNTCTDNITNISNNNISINTNISNFNSINITSSSLTVVGTLVVSGNASIENSSVSISLSNTVVKGDLTLANSDFTFNSNSSITVDGCVYLKNNTQIKVDVSNYLKEKEKNVTLIKSLNVCLDKEGSISFQYLNQQKCLSIASDIQPGSLLLVMDYSKCEVSIGFKPLLINLIAVFTLLFIN